MCRLSGVKSSMKVISYNIWGLGGFDKRNEMLIMVQEKTHFVMCLQESNVGLVDDLLVQSIWGSSSCGYSFQPFNAAFGGLLYVWDSSEVEVWSFMSFEHVVELSLLAKSLWLLMCMHHTTRRRNKFCGTDYYLLFIITITRICVFVVTLILFVPRKSRGTVYRQGDMDVFNKFIDDSLLVDLPIYRRLFTWYRGDGVSMSRLDRFLLSVN